MMYESPPEMQICAEWNRRSMIGATPVFYSGQWTTDGEGMRLRRMFIEWDYHTSSETEPMFPGPNISLGARADRRHARLGMIERRCFQRAEGWIARRGDFFLPAFVCFFGAFFSQEKKAEFLK